MFRYRKKEFALLGILGDISNTGFLMYFYFITKVENPWGILRSDPNWIKLTKFGWKAKIHAK